MTSAQKSSGNKIYQIKVTLLRTPPPIWRRLLVPSDITLSNLHDLLQLAMGWTDSHLHEFLFRGQCYGPTGPERGVAEAIDERKVRLNQLLVRVGAKIVYTYDFGDGWEHGIVLEKGLPVDPNRLAERTRLDDSWRLRWRDSWQPAQSVIEFLLPRLHTKSKLQNTPETFLNSFFEYRPLSS